MVACMDRAGVSLVPVGKAVGCSRERGAAFLARACPALNAQL